MSRLFGPRALRLATIAVFVAVAVVAWVQFKPDHPRRFKLNKGELTVAKAIDTAGADPVAVRGFLFNDADFGLRLCNGFVSSKPPSCIGPFVDLYGVDEGSFSLKSGRDKAGRKVLWVDEPVAVYGTVVGTAMRVQSVLQ